MDEIFLYGGTVAVQVVIFFVLIFAGFFLAKCGMLKKSGIEQITDLLLFIVTPCVIVKAFSNVEFTAENLKLLLISSGCAVTTHLVGMGIALIFKRAKPQSRQAVLRFAIIFSNGGFMAIPMAEALIGDVGVFLVSPYVVVLNLFAWIYGVMLFPENKGVSVRHILLNPGTIGVIAGLPVFLLSLSLPQVVSVPVGYMAALNTPIAMLVTGFYLLYSNLKSGLRDAGMWGIIAVRLAAVPLVMFLIFKFLFGLSGVMLLAVMIPAAAPCAVNNMLISAKFGGDTALASRLISASTLLSVLSMPLILMLCKIGA